MHIFLTELSFDAVSDGDSMEWCHKAASSTSSGDTGVRAKDKNPIFFLSVREFGISVLKHNHTFPRKVKRDSRVLRIVFFYAFIQNRLVKETETIQCGQDIVHLSVNGFLRDDSRLYKRDDSFLCEVHPFWTFEIKPSIDGT